MFWLTSNFPLYQAIELSCVWFEYKDLVYCEFGAITEDNRRVYCHCLRKRLIEFGKYFASLQEGAWLKRHGIVSKIYYLEQLPVVCRDDVCKLLVSGNFDYDGEDEENLAVAQSEFSKTLKMMNKLEVVKVSCDKIPWQSVIDVISDKKCHFSIGVDTILESIQYDFNHKQISMTRCIHVQFNDIMKEAKNIEAIELHSIENWHGIIIQSGLKRFKKSLHTLHASTATIDFDTLASMSNLTSLSFGKTVNNLANKVLPFLANLQYLEIPYFKYDAKKKFLEISGSGAYDVELVHAMLALPTLSFQTLSFVHTVDPQALQLLILCHVANITILHYSNIHSATAEQMLELLTHAKVLVECELSGCGDLSEAVALVSHHSSSTLQKLHYRHRDVTGDTVLLPLPSILQCTQLQVLSYNANNTRISVDTLCIILDHLRTLVSLYAVTLGSVLRDRTLYINGTRDLPIIARVPIKWYERVEVSLDYDDPPDVSLQMLQLLSSTAAHASVVHLIVRAVIPSQLIQERLRITTLTAPYLSLANLQTILCNWKLQELRTTIWNLKRKERTLSLHISDSIEHSWVTKTFPQLLRILQQAAPSGPSFLSPPPSPQQQWWIDSVHMDCCLHYAVYHSLHALPKLQTLVIYRCVTIETIVLLRRTAHKHLRKLHLGLDDSYFYQADLVKELKALVAECQALQDVCVCCGAVNCTVLTLMSAGTDPD